MGTMRTAPFSARLLEFGNAGPGCKSIPHEGAAVAVDARRAAGCFRPQAVRGAPSRRWAAPASFRPSRSARYCAWTDPEHLTREASGTHRRKEFERCP